jgi:hypothetical protein
MRAAATPPRSRRIISPASRSPFRMGVRSSIRNGNRAAAVRHRRLPITCEGYRLIGRCGTPASRHCRRDRRRWRLLRGGRVRHVLLGRSGRGFSHRLHGDGAGPIAASLPRVDATARAVGDRGLSFAGLIGLRLMRSQSLRGLLRPVSSLNLKSRQPRNCRREEGKDRDAGCAVTKALGTNKNPSCQSGKC